MTCCYFVHHIVHVQFWEYVWVRRREVNMCVNLACLYVRMCVRAVSRQSQTNSSTESIEKCLTAESVDSTLKQTEQPVQPACKKQNKTSHKSAGLCVFVLQVYYKWVCPNVKLTHNAGMHTCTCTSGLSQQLLTHLACSSTFLACIKGKPMPGLEWTATGCLKPR